jgi:hypothetical protein
MKSFIKHLIPLYLVCLAGCDDNNSLHQPYLDRGETIYIGGIDSIIAMPGFNRVKFDWKGSTDPRITKTVFSWEQGERFFEVPVGKEEIGLSKSKIHELPEGVYNFEVINADKIGNRSLSATVTVEIYGNSYKESLRNMNVLSIEVSDDNTELTIRWAGIESELTQYTTVHYLSRANPNPAPDPIRVENTDTETIIPNLQIQTGDSISVITTYLPEDGIDAVDAIPKKYAVK